MCRVVVYHNRSAGGAVPTATTIFDTNDLFAGRNVTFSKRYTLMDDITHQMVVTTLNSTNGIATTGPSMFKCLRIPVNKKVQFNGNAGTISDLIEEDYGIGFASDTGSCCNIQINAKVWFKDI